MKTVTVTYTQWRHYRHHVNLDLQTWLRANRRSQPCCEVRLVCENTMLAAINLHVPLQQGRAVHWQHSTLWPGKAPPVSGGLLDNGRAASLLLLASLAELAWCPIKHKHFDCDGESNSHAHSTTSNNSSQSVSDKTRHWRHTQSSISCSTPLTLRSFFLVTHAPVYPEV